MSNYRVGSKFWFENKSEKMNSSLDYKIMNEHRVIDNANVELKARRLIRKDVFSFHNNLQEVLAGIGMCQLPDGASDKDLESPDGYAWREYVDHTFICSPYNVNIYYSNVFYVNSLIWNYSITHPKAMNANFQVVASPSVDALKRWESVYVSDMTRLLSGLRKHYSCAWDDNSVTEIASSSTWDRIAFSYNSREPVKSIVYPITHIKDSNGNTIEQMVLDFNLSVHFYIPQAYTPTSCKVVREKVIETVTKEVIRIECDGD